MSTVYVNMITLSSHNLKKGMRHLANISLKIWLPPARRNQIHICCPDFKELSFFSMQSYNKIANSLFIKCLIYYFI